jgi:hypothetical protein
MTGMAERDPFGRLPDENPLAGLGALSDGTSSQPGQPVVVAAEEDWSGGEPTAAARPAAAQRPPAQDRPATSAASARPAQPRPASPAQSRPAIEQSLAEVIRQAEAMSGVKVVQSARVVGRVVRLVVFLVILAVVFSVGKPIFDAGKDVRDAVSNRPSAGKIANDVAPLSSAADGQGSEAKVPTGLSSSSMLTRRNFGRAMDRLSTSGLGRLRTLTIRPERIDAQLLTRGGGLRSVQIKSGDPKIDQFGSAGGGGFSHLETVLFSKIDASAPARLARSATGRLQKPVGQIDYVVLTRILNQTMWLGYTKSGKAFQANAHGRITRRIN